MTKRDLARAVVVAIVILAAGPLSTAAAAGVNVTITSPANETTTNNPPIIEGETEETSDPVVVNVKFFEGTGITPEGGKEPFETVQAHRVANAWSAQAKTLPKGTYTAVAEEFDPANEEREFDHVVFTVAAPPEPHITLTPQPGVIATSRPSFDGTAEEAAQVTLRIFVGTEAAGTEVESVSVTPKKGNWSRQVVGPLADNTYTAIAEQGSAKSSPSTFTIKTAGPEVSLSPVAPTSSGLELISGSAGTLAGDLPGITVQLFSGAAAEGSPVETIGVIASEGAWSTTLAGLSPGVYTVRALQSNEAGNRGVSSAMTFTVSPVIPLEPGPLSPPFASFTSVPANPSIGQSVALVSNSSGVSSPITGYAWDPAGSGRFTAGGALLTTSFSTAGRHLVQLRVTDADGLSSVATQAINVSPAPAVLMQPFPIVRITGSVTAGGARVKLLSVQAPLSTMITITCKGHGCGRKSESRLAAASASNRSHGGAVTLAFKHFERSLKSGTVLQIRVTKAGQIGKYTSFAIRHHRFPVRIDACLMPTSATPVACPAS